ncbi:hypothetical protein RF11_01219 [Thelohanellus kitauei]|uniref:Homeobox domain-containing protein n=1 Tax=Thelohanellus kitauei TaxID=669202 RepID=A0A0C2MDK8_THEKT|nr:hypothetical protein RF11_02509 [Thelohanellus kitauei]KII62887.1 hypothetical protein RF11_01219 [Thelohanellus kitauei]
MESKDRNRYSYGYQRNTRYVDSKFSQTSKNNSSKFDFAHDQSSEHYNTRKENHLRNTITKQEDNNSVNAPRIFRDSGAGNYFRQNPTYISDERMIELLKIQKGSSSKVAVDDSYADYSSDVIVKGYNRSPFTINEPENIDDDESYNERTSKTSTESSISGYVDTTYSSASSNNEIIDKLNSWTKPKIIRFSNKETLFLNEIFKEKPYLKNNDIKNISSWMEVPEHRIQNWWRHRRAMERIRVASLPVNNDPIITKTNDPGCNETATNKEQSYT